VLTSRCNANGIANAAKAMEKEIDFQIRQLWPRSILINLGASRHSKHNGHAYDKGRGLRELALV